MMHQHFEKTDTKLNLPVQGAVEVIVAQPVAAQSVGWLEFALASVVVALRIKTK